MNRYVLRFYKKGNMRFISHLDLQRLFKRCIKRAGVVTDYSKGFNPHEKVNTCQPLSLGFETDSDYFEFETPFDYEPSDLCSRLNLAMPEGLRFTDCKIIPGDKKNLSAKCDAASYSVVLPLCSSQKLHINDFLSQDKVIIIKRDKKTGKYVEKDVRSFIYSVAVEGRTDDTVTLSLLVRCASNETLNPSSLLESLWKYEKLAYPAHEVRITRNDLYAFSGEECISIFDLYDNKQRQ